jgi:hydrogenase expression/formation protein HypC
MKIIKKTGDTGIVQLENVTYNADFRLVPDVKIGDYVIVHAGFAIQKLDEKDAAETLDIIKQMQDITSNK